MITGRSLFVNFAAALLCITTLALGSGPGSGGPSTPPCPPPVCVDLVPCKGFTCVPVPVPGGGVSSWVYWGCYPGQPNGLGYTPTTPGYKDAATTQCGDLYGGNPLVGCWLYHSTCSNRKYVKCP